MVLLHLSLVSCEKWYDLGDRLFGNPIAVCLVHFANLVLMVVGFRHTEKPLPQLESVALVC